MPVAVFNQAGSPDLAVMLPACPPDVAAWAERYIDPRDVIPLAPFDRAAALANSALPIPHLPPTPPVRVGVMTIPLTGFSRFGTYFGVCDKTALATITKLATVSGNSFLYSVSGYVVGLYAFDGRSAFASTVPTAPAMPYSARVPSGPWGWYLLPPRPLSLVSGGEWYLLPFVDWRYFLWNRSFNAGDLQSYSTFATLLPFVIQMACQASPNGGMYTQPLPSTVATYDAYSGITGAQTGMFFRSADYRQWGDANWPLPVLADALLAAVGCRAAWGTSYYDGIPFTSVGAVQDAAGAITAFDNFFAEANPQPPRTVVAGGPFDAGFHKSRVFSHVSVLFPQTARRWPYRKDVSLSSLSLSEYSGATPIFAPGSASGLQPCVSTPRWALTTGVAVANSAEVASRANAVATAHYLWQARGCDVVYAGANGTPPCGFFDRVEIYDGPDERITTRLVSVPPAVPEWPAQLRPEYSYRVQPTAAIAGTSNPRFYSCTVAGDDGRQGYVLENSIPDADRIIGSGYVQFYASPLSGNPDPDDLTVSGNKLTDGPDNVTDIATAIGVGLSSQFKPAKLIGAVTLGGVAQPLFEITGQGEITSWQTANDKIAGVQGYAFFVSGVTDVTITPTGTPGIYQLAKTVTTDTWEFGRSTLTGAFQLVRLNSANSSVTNTTFGEATAPPASPPP